MSANFQTKHMIITNPFVQLVLGMFICATIGSYFTKNHDPFAVAGTVAFLAGIGYFILKIITH